MMSEGQNINQNGASSTQPANLDWEQEKTKVRVRQFMNILEQLPRLCSPTICGTLSQPTTRAERANRGAEMFDWSLEQKAILSPANITTDTDGTDDWQNAAELNPVWRQQESEMFFSQRTIAPSPLVTPSTRQIRSSEEDDEDDDEEGRDFTIEVDENEMTEYDDDQDDQEEDMMDNLYFSPQPMRSSQTQQKMDIFSPDSFVRVMEDEHTLQSTPKTTGSLQRARTRTRGDVID